MKKLISVFPTWLLITMTFIIIVLILLLFFIYDYNAIKTAKGFEDEIFVLADSLEYEKLQESLRATFEKEIYTPQPENIFTLIRVDSNDIEKLKQSKNIVIAAPLNSGSAASNFLSSIIDTSTRRNLTLNPDSIIYETDLWAKGQLVTLLVAPSVQELESKILKNSDDLLMAYQKKSDERLFNNLYNPRNEHLNVEGSFLKDYGWVIYVETEFKVASNIPEDKFVWLQRSPGSDIERWIFIHWIENATPDYLNADSIKSIRDRLTKKYYKISDDTSYVVVAADNFTTNEINLNGRYAIFTQGLWNLSADGMGGPFVNYVFFDEDKQRFYMLDGSVYAPKHYKRNLIQQMDVTLQSFRTINELTPERKNELLNAVID